MQKHDTHFTHVWGYGLLVLWCTSSLMMFASQIPMYWPNILTALWMTLSSMIFMSLFAVPIAAILTLVIGGLGWLVLNQTQLSNSLKAVICGGLSGSLIMLPFALADFLNGQPGLVLFVLLMGLLGIWCGWLGERLARRHVKVDMNAIADSFD